MTPLKRAAYHRHTEVVKILIKAGASIDGKSNVSKRISICRCMCVCVCVLTGGCYSFIILYDNLKVSFYSINTIYYNM